jgi:hypothetical protein
MRSLLGTSLQDVADHLNQDVIKSNDMMGKVSRIERYIAGNLGISGSSGNSSDTKRCTDAQLDVFRNVVASINRKVDQLIADTHQDSVKFNGFGFRRVEEANAWIATHLPDHKFGLIVDVHMVFEHVYCASAKTVPTLQQLDMKDMSQGIAVSSFDHQIPKLLTNETGYSVVKMDESYFDQIRSYKEWEEPGTGFRERLKADLSAFKLAHKKLVDNNTIPSSPLQAVASLSRTYAVSWIEAFVFFIDDTYAELTRAKFSHAHGWSLITRLASRILLESQYHEMVSKILLSQDEMT